MRTAASWDLPSQRTSRTSWASWSTLRRPFCPGTEHRPRCFSSMARGPTLVTRVKPLCRATSSLCRSPWWAVSSTVSTQFNSHHQNFHSSNTNFLALDINFKSKFTQNSLKNYKYLGPRRSKFPFFRAKNALKKSDFSDSRKLEWNKVVLDTLRRVPNTNLCSVFLETRCARRNRRKDPFPKKSFIFYEVRVK